MALRVRTNGRIFCAALCEEEAGDTYIDDALHYEMSVVHRVLVTETAERHQTNGEWWWRNAVPPGIEIASQYKTEKDDILDMDNPPKCKHGVYEYLYCTECANDASKLHVTSKLVISREQAEAEAKERLNKMLGPNSGVAMDAMEVQAEAVRDALTKFNEEISKAREYGLVVNPSILELETTEGPIHILEVAILRRV